MTFWQKLIALLVALAGLIAVAAAVAVDFVGLSDQGIGPKQVNLGLVGAALFFVGIAFVTPLGQRFVSRLVAYESRERSARRRGGRLLIIALWFGLVGGLIEGIGFVILMKARLLSNTSVEIIWISAIFNAALLGIIGLCLSVLTRIFPRLPLTLPSVLLFSLLTFSSWLMLALTGRGVHAGAQLLLSASLAVIFTRWFWNRDSVALRFWRKSLPFAAAAVVVAFVVIQGSTRLQERRAVASLPAADPNLPSVLFIVVDTLRADHLSTYGYQRATSPNIDRIAKEGTLFENAFSAASYTLPSHASLFTGLHQYQHGVTWRSVRPYKEHPDRTLAEVFQDNGYRTAGFSANLYWINRAMGFGRGFIRFEDFFHSPYDMALRTVYGSRIESAMPGKWLKQLGRKRAADINDSVISWLEQDRDRPSFIFINYYDTHDPYLPPQPYRSMFAESENVGGILDEQLGQDTPRMTPEQFEGEIAAYDGAIAYVDTHIGQLLSEIQERGMGNNLLVVITSDHGEAFGEHGLFQHANSLYKEEIHVPLILWHPGRVQAGLRISQPVSNAALPATLMDMVSLPDSQAFPGPSLAQLWDEPGNPQSWPLTLVETEQVPWAMKTAPLRQGSMRSLISPEWHYLEHESLDTELYNWADDSLEARNMAGSAEGQPVVELFRRTLETTLARFTQASLAR